MRVGLRLQDDFEGNTTFDAAARLVLTDLNRYGAEWVWDGQIGGNPRLGTQIYLPFSLQRRWFLEPSVLWQIRDVPQFEGDDRVGELRVRSIRYGGALGRELGISGEMRVGAERELGRSWERFGVDQIAPLHFQHNELYARYSFDTLDSAAFPTPRHCRDAGMAKAGREPAHRAGFGRASTSTTASAHSWGKNTAIAWVSGGALLNAGVRG